MTITTCFGEVASTPSRVGVLGTKKFGFSLEFYGQNSSMIDSRVARTIFIQVCMLTELRAEVSRAVRFSCTTFYSNSICTEKKYKLL